jgi:hypothetical protein
MQKMVQEILSSLRKTCGVEVDAEKATIVDHVKDAGLAIVSCFMAFFRCVFKALAAANNAFQESLRESLSTA